MAWGAKNVQHVGRTFQLNAACSSKVFGNKNPARTCIIDCKVDFFRASFKERKREREYTHTRSSRNTVAREKNAIK